MIAYIVDLCYGGYVYLPSEKDVFFYLLNHKNKQKYYEALNAFRWCQTANVGDEYEKGDI